MAGRIEATKTFIEECAAELKKVTWPDYEQGRSATLVIILFCFLVSAIIWIMDLSVRTILEFIMRMFGA